MIINHPKITPQYSQDNGMIEKFMKALSKAIKASLYGNRNWKEDLHEVIRNYISSIHVTTGNTSPAQPFFNRSLNQNLPTAKETKSQYSGKVRTRQDSIYKKVINKFNDKHY